MSCRNYETILTEVARGQMLDARARTDALAHTETCARCAARLANEQALSAGLRALSSSAATSQTPACVEEKLLAAFRQGPNFVPAVTHVVSPQQRRVWWAVAAAVAILAVSTFAALRLLPGNTKQPAEQGAKVVQPTPHTTPPWREDERNVAEPERAVASGADNQDRKLIPVVQPQRPRREARRGLVRDAGVSPEVASADEEIATDFMPLSYGSSLSQIDDGQVVRVELSRSALHSFGLPVNVERAGERVKADVLLGNDGVARAIRFVR
ncbi:MAG TPA: hypothetical protein VJT74_06460 [Pyrinomonadaceae bacterium]|nr:hypothetical protein [Pyrinomonadaceae bacterium]